MTIETSLVRSKLGALSLRDQSSVEELFSRIFGRVLEVYKKAPDRLWGYYVLPIFHRDRFVGRLDSRHDGQTWTIHNWWWEEGVGRTIEMLEAVQAATGQFVRYLGAEDVKVSHQVDPVTRSAIHAWWPRRDLPNIWALRAPA